MRMGRGVTWALLTRISTRRKITWGLRFHQSFMFHLWDGRKKTSESFRLARDVDDLHNHRTQSRRHLLARLLTLAEGRTWQRKADDELHWLIWKLWKFVEIVAHDYEAPIVLSKLVEGNFECRSRPPLSSWLFLPRSKLRHDKLCRATLHIQVYVGWDNLFAAWKVHRPNRPRAKRKKIVKSYWNRSPPKATLSANIFSPPSHETFCCSF